MELAKGRSMQPKTQMPPLLPPEVKKVPGRPKFVEGRHLKNLKKVKKILEKVQL